MEQTPKEVREYISRKMLVLMLTDIPKQNPRALNVSLDRLNAVSNIMYQIDVYRSMVSTDTFLKDSAILKFRQQEIAKTAQILLHLHQHQSQAGNDLLSTDKSEADKIAIRTTMANIGIVETQATYIFNHLSQSYAQDYGEEKLLSLPYVSQLKKQHQKPVNPSLKGRLIQAQNDQTTSTDKTKITAHPVIIDDNDVSQQPITSQLENN